ncbi:hypothetical protein ACFWBI_31885 [Streptomyces sp. NPDC059982]
MIIFVMIAWPSMGEAVGAYADLLAISAALAGGGTAVVYRNHGNHA